MIADARPGPTTIRRELLDDARQALAMFAAGSSAPSLWNDVLERSQPTKDLPDGDALVLVPGLLDRPERLRGLLGIPSAVLHTRVVQRDLVVGSNDPILELLDFGATLEAPLRLALDVLLRRALDPFDALATYPLEALFAPDEAAWLRSAERSVTPVRPAYRGPTDLSYDGYVLVIGKVTRLCNLRCTYCHDWRAGAGQTMPFETQARMFQRVLGAPGTGSLDYIWHGGEPTLIKRRGFLRGLALQRWFHRPGQQIHNRVQSNAAMLDDEWIRFFARYGFAVSISIDGPARTHNQTRLDARGRPTFELVRENMRRVQNAGLLCQVLIVVGEAIIELGARELLRFLREDLGVHRVGLLPVRPSNDGSIAAEVFLERHRWFQFLLDLDFARRQEPRPPIEIREIDELLNALAGLATGSCELRGNCVGTFFLVEADGSVAHCDKFVGDQFYTLGNIRDQTLDEIRATKRVTQIRLQNRVSVDKKRSCSYLWACRGWCPHERYLAERHNPGHDMSCCGLAGVFEELQRRQERSASAYRSLQATTVDTFR